MLAVAIAVVIVIGLQFRPGASVLDQALETQLASAQPADAPVRIGFTFKSRDGVWCRTFERDVESGIACRTEDGWTVRKVEHDRPPVGGDYRHAGSPEIAATAQAMAADAPLDAALELALVKRGWRE